MSRRHRFRRRLLSSPASPTRWSPGTRSTRLRLRNLWRTQTSSSRIIQILTENLPNDLGPSSSRSTGAAQCRRSTGKSTGSAGRSSATFSPMPDFFHGAHRAMDDCMAVLELLARPLPATSTTAFAVLVDRARRTTFRVWAQNSPYDLKNALKRRGYRWSDGSDGRLRSWYIDVDEDKRDAELDYLRREIYQRDVDILCS